MRAQNLMRACGVGLLGTVGMGIIMLAAPFMGIPMMNMPNMMGMTMANFAMGWLLFLCVGMAFALIYTALYSHLPMSGWMKGAFFGALPWLVTQMMILPVMGMGFFSASLSLAVSNLVAFLIYGACLGLLYRPAACAKCA